MIAAGTYRATPTCWGLGESKNGTEQFVIEFKLGDGMKIEAYLFFSTEKNTKRSIQSLRYCGWTGNDIRDVQDLDSDVEIVVEHEEYNGKMRAKVLWINALGGNVSKQVKMAPDKAKAFAEKLRASIAEVDAKDGAPTPKPKKVENVVADSFRGEESGDDSGLPF